MQQQKNNLLIALLLTLCIALFSTTIISCTVTKQMTNNADYWKERSLAAEAVIDSLINHYDDAYIYDVFMETDTWDEYSYLKYEEYERQCIQATSD